MTPVLSVANLEVNYRIGQAAISAVRDVSLTIASREALGIVGESGSGKTQTFMAVMGLLGARAQARGSVRFEGRELLGASRQALNEVRGARLSMIFQDPMTSLTPQLKVGTQLAEMLVVHRGFSWRRAREAALEILQRVRVNDPERRLRQYPFELSGGMRQRVLIGMSLLCEPSLVIADEPTSALDATVQAQIIDLFRALRHEQRLALVLISHDFGVVAGLADRIAVMYAGRVVEYGRAGELLERAQHPYTDLLLQCVPRLEGPRRERMAFIPGQPPSPAERSPGCAFAPRCPRAQDLCRRERPLLKSLHGDSRLADGPRPVHAPPPADASQVACHFPLHA